MFALTVAASIAIAMPAANPQAEERPKTAVAAFLESESVEAKELRTPLPADPADPLWLELPALEIRVAAQRTIRLHDRQANEAARSSENRIVLLRCAHDRKEIAFALEWTDETEDRASLDDPAVFGDAAAIEIPVAFGPGRRLPHVAMGEEGHEVLLHFVRSMQPVSSTRTLVAAGFGSSTRIDSAGVRGALAYDRRERKWRAVFTRPLSSPELDLREGIIPVAVAVWDGHKAERSGNKALSAWKFVRLPRQAVSASFAHELAYGYGPDEQGDVAKGKVLVEAICGACHHVGDKRIAMPGLAPDLTNIGVMSTPAYLRDSLLNPSEVIVPNTNPNQRYRRGATPDSNGAFPNDPSLDWFVRDATGKKVSKMPAFGQLPKADLNAMIAFMRTLGSRDDGATPREGGPR